MNREVTELWSDALGDLLAAGRLKIYCVDSYDAASWP